MKKALIAASVAVVMSASAQADTLLGLYIGGSVWDADVSGSYKEGNNDFTEFNLNSDKNGHYYVAFEHPIPLIPNIKIASTELTTDGSATDVTFDFKDASFVSADVNTELDLSFIDYTLYYEIFDNDLLSFDMGLTARKFDGDVSVIQADDSANTASLELSQIVPMIYVSTVVGLPFTGFSVFAEGNLLSIDDSTIYDYQAGVSYAVLDNLAVDFNINLGYRASMIELEDVDDFYSDLEFKGVFLGATVHF
jgi:outer membrane protein